MYGTNTKIMKSMNTETLQLFKDEYFTLMNCHDDYSRKREIVIHRKAWAVVAIQYATFQSVGAVLGRDHSTVTYYNNKHLSEMIYDDYRKAYDAAMEIAKKYTAEKVEIDVKELIIVNKELVEKVDLLRKEVTRLYVYKVNYEKIANAMSNVR
tara:strand:+ start:1013 stop:1471 length:459 start_codon:yes stop_codon:yes gene_type:complete